MKRFRWIMGSVCLFDVGNTLVGQPSSFWGDPSTANKMNSFFRPFLMHGSLPFVAVSLVCIAGLIFLSYMLPRGIGLIVLLSATLSSYFGACTWLSYNFGLGEAGSIGYAILLSILLAAGGRA